MKPVRVNSRDEIGQLAEDFNRMADRLSEIWKH
ncbi:MAG: HAMP domain-containing protein [Frisingicoccus sp.]